MAAGLIPARAGKTGPPSPPTRPAKAHPRACGENRGVGRGLRCPLGSSPRVRGKPLGHHRAHERRRLIPARAGKTAAPSITTATPTAHPRACGENAASASRTAAATGSSPRVRGKPRDTTLQRVSSGLIPARAGKTGPGKGARSSSPAHPRACGENRAWQCLSGLLLGSSPRVRGKPQCAFCCSTFRRLIPARAGKTTWWPGSRSCPGAHPRACGENFSSPVSPVSIAGSSPRVRGKQRQPRRDAESRGLIPARAGKT